MSNELSILGFGQCGSRIAVELSASFNPTDILSGAPSVSFKFLWEKFGRKRPTEAGQYPLFYIADLNRSNGVYVYYTKAQAINEILDEHGKQINNREIVERVKRPGIRLDKSDYPLIDDVRKHGAGLKMVNALHFAAGNEPLLDVGGAGGLQYLSEAIAAQDRRLLTVIDRRKGGALVGIFALGGGTGSGSLFSVLKHFKDEIARYTIGVGILPYRDSVDQFVNAGRYLTKFLGAQPEDRFNTLLLFSNDVAQEVLMGSELVASEDPLEIINGYVSAFVHDFSLINDDQTQVLFGKLFDPMDGKRYLSGIATVGYASDTYGNDHRYSAKDLFVNAMSPMKYEYGRISGVAVQVSRAEREQKTKEGVDTPDTANVLPNMDSEHRMRTIVGDTLRELVGLLENDDVDRAAEIGQKLRSLTPFYRSVKSVLVFYFLVSKDFLNETFRFQRLISRTFRTLAGSDISITTNCYLVGNDTDRQDNSVLVLCGDAFSYEVEESTLAYVQRSFIQGRAAQGAFGKGLREILAGVQDVEAIDEVEGQIGEALERLFGDVDHRSVERTDDASGVGILENPDVRGMVGESQLARILIRRPAVEQALVRVARQYMLGQSRLDY